MQGPVPGLDHDQGQGRAAVVVEGGHSLDLLDILDPVCGHAISTRYTTDRRYLPIYTLYLPELLDAAGPT